MPTFLDTVADELAALERVGLRRTLRPLVGPQGPVLGHAGRRVLNFSSNDYLGLAGDPRLLPSSAELDEGTGAGASRLIAGNLAAHRALEAELAAWLGADAVLLFNSGYQANVGVVSALAGPDDVVFSDSLNHASLIDGCRLSRARVVVYPHRALDALATALRTAPPARRRLILSDSVFSMDGDTAPIAGLVELARAHGAALVLDEAHAFGALGPRGTGLGAGAPVDIRIGTLGKSFGCFGAFVAGPRPVIDLLLNRARSFVFTTALPVPILAAARRALPLVAGAEGDRRRADLAARAALFHVELERAGLRPPAPAAHIVPLHLAGGEPQAAVDLSNALLAEGLFAHPIRPPTVPVGTSRLRLSLMATHTPDHVREAVALLARHRARLT